jgi:hypothetical protein
LSGSQSRKTSKIAPCDASAISGFGQVSKRDLRPERSQFTQNCKPMPLCDDSAAKLQTAAVARSKRGSVNIYAAIPTKVQKSMRCQFRQTYDQKKVRNI